ncbi:MAG TPA: hypothetical protein VEL12_06875 [Candidatus Nitrosopolaris sp.]|nr:hypothetical protein [Candidatus Nitrosopolaris sp.]
MSDENKKPPIDWMPLPEGSHLEIGARAEPVPLVGITLDFVGGKLSFTYTPAEAREIAAAIIEAADRLDREQIAGQN